MLQHQVVLHLLSQYRQCFLDGKAAIDNNFLGGVVDRGKAGRAPRVPIQQAIGEEPLVIHPVPGSDRCQRLD